MTPSEVARLRLDRQGIAAGRFGKPSEVVRWFGAVQAQDYLGSLWALGLRLRGANEVEVERAVADRSIVRTWPLRGTLHFVAAGDVRCVLARALAGGRQLTRPELADALERGGVATDGQRLIHLLNRSALEGLTCYAARRGKQFTFALFDEWAPSDKSLTRDEALAELSA